MFCFDFTMGECLSLTLNGHSWAMLPYFLNISNSKSESIKLPRSMILQKSIFIFLSPIYGVNFLSFDVLYKKVSFNYNYYKL